MTPVFIEDFSNKTNDVAIVLQMPNNIEHEV